MKSSSPHYQISLRFQEIKLPPFDEILVLGSKSEQGKMGVAKTFEHLVPEIFEMIEVPDDAIEAIFVNKRLLKKISKENILDILREKVFPFVSAKEIIKVDLEITVSYETIEKDG
ncbi:MAG: hypothetical protein WA960_11775 [Tunicatimonas sp.]